MKQRNSLVFLALFITSLAFAQSDPLRELWGDATDATIGTTGEWTNKVELADLDGDGWVDILFANGGDYDTPGVPEPSRVFLNQGAGRMFEEVTESVFGPGGMLARVIKVQDVNNDGRADIMVGTTYQTQSRLYLGDGEGAFTEVTTAHLPQLEASVGDLEFGDVDGDGDLDMVLADWGAGNPMSNGGGRTMLWLNDGEGRFADATEAQMPDILVKFSWDLEFVDVDNDYDLDILVSCKRCAGGFLFTNDGTGSFSDRSEWLPQFTNNYEFEAMDLDGNGYLDVVTINDAENFREHLFLNTGHGYEVATAEFWPLEANPGYDDNMVIFLDFDSDGDADFLIASLDGWDRLLVNDGSGHLSLVDNVFSGSLHAGTLGMAVADLDGDGRLDVVEGQGEDPDAIDERVYLGKSIRPDRAPPVVTMVEQVTAEEGIRALQVRARVHDNSSPSRPHDWQEVVVRWSENAQPREAPMSWYGEYLWRGTVEPGASSYQVCATDAAGNEACSAMLAMAPNTESSTPAPCPNPDGGVCLGALAAGTYATSSFDPRITYTVPDGWLNLEDLPGNFLLQMTDDVRYLGIYQNVRAPAECAEAGAAGVGGTVEDLVGWYRAHPGLTTTEPEAVNVGGLSGVFLDMSLEPSWDVTCFFSEGRPVVPFIIGNGTSLVHHVILPGFTERIYLLEWNGGNVVIEVGPEGNSLDDYLIEVSPIIESLRFGP